MVVFTVTFKPCIWTYLEMAKQQGVSKVYVHAFLDGRDTPPASAKGFVETGLRIRWQKSELVRSHLYQVVTMQWTEIITGTE